jgi:hypothetical protein
MAAKKITTHNFKGMEDVKGTLKGPMERDAVKALKLLKDYRIVSTAGDYGAVNVYINDAGKYRAQFMHYCEVLNDQTFETKTELYGWMQEYFPKCREA